MKYAVVTRLDQTYGYRTKEGGYTTKHPEAELWDDVQQASAVAAKDTALNALAIRREDKDFADMTDETLIQEVICVVEAVEDEAEFRAREDTW